MKYSQIVGVGSYLPAKVLTNVDLENMMDTTHEWIVTRSGICQRHLAASGELTSDLAFHAGLHALKNAGLSTVDAIFLATSTPDHTFPPTAVRVQAKMGLSNCFAFDVGAACNGFMTALISADAYIQTGMIDTALVIGAETMSRICDWNDRSTAVLFGDGAGAFVIKASERKSFSKPILKSDGTGYDDMYVQGGPSSSDKVGKIFMNGRAVFRKSIESFEKIVRSILEQENTRPEDISWFVMHQANWRILKAVAQALNIPEERFLFTGDQHANTSAASIPLAFYEGIVQGKLVRGQKMLFAGFAAGYSWSAMIVDF